MWLFRDPGSVSVEPVAYYRNFYDSRSPVANRKAEIHSVRLA